jgi:hypothetical protein
MNQNRFSMSALVFGLVFIALGTLFLLDELDVFDLNPVYVIPILLIGLGIGIIAGNRRARPTNV